MTPLHCSLVLADISESLSSFFFFFLAGQHLRQVHPLPTPLRSLMAHPLQYLHFNTCISIHAKEIYDKCGYMYLCSNRHKTRFTFRQMPVRLHTLFLSVRFSGRNVGNQQSRGYLRVAPQAPAFVGVRREPNYTQNF